MFPFPFSFVAPTSTGIGTVDNVYSMEFDGVDDYIDCGNDTSLQFSGSDLKYSSTIGPS